MYLNRLSDLLFVLARALNRAAGQPTCCGEGSRRRLEGSDDGRQARFRPQRPPRGRSLARVALADQAAFAELYRHDVVASVRRSRCVS